MDYLIRKIIHLRVEKRVGGGASSGNGHAIKEVIVSGSIGSAMFESLSEEGNRRDYYSYDEDNDD